jgi:hypothetical protein
MNTAKLRSIAADYESNLDWANAAIYWRKAVAAYPEYATRSELGKQDIANMERFARTCELAVKCKLFVA